MLKLLFWLSTCVKLICSCAARQGGGPGEAESAAGLAGRDARRPRRRRRKGRARAAQAANPGLRAGRNAGKRCRPDKHQARHRACHIILVVKCRVCAKVDMQFKVELAVYSRFSAASKRHTDNTLIALMVNSIYCGVTSAMFTCRRTLARAQLRA